MPKLWKITPQKHPDLLENLLKNRGLKTEADKEAFFNPKLDYFMDDMKIKGLETAKKRIFQAIENKETIVVFGDYDVDGVCASAVLYHGLTALGARVLPYIPHREKEGYGLNKQGIDFAKENQASLVVTVDNGIVAFEAAEYAKKLKIDLIITDHHQVLEKGEKKVFPKALAIVHSTKICGAGVAWVLIRSLVPNLSDELLDLVAIATVADMMPLWGINRFFVKEGVKRLKTTLRPGLKALLAEAAILPKDIEAYHLGYIIGPRLNAIGRLEHALDALRLLCTKDPTKARLLAQKLCQANDQRKKFTTEALLEASQMVTEGNFKKQNHKIYILHSQKWLPGIIGLVAGRVAEEHNVATIAISQGEVFSKGSARSANGLNIVEVIRQQGDLLVEVGGHAGAAGFTIETKHLDQFKNQLLASLQDQVIDHEPVLEIEAVLPVKLLTKKTAEVVKKFEPFGVSNKEPVLATLGMRVEELRTVGEGKHLKIKADEVEGIGFGMGKLSSLLEVGQYIDVAYFLQIDSFNGVERVQLRIQDIRIS